MNISIRQLHLTPSVTSPDYLSGEDFADAVIHKGFDSPELNAAFWTGLVKQHTDDMTDDLPPDDVLLHWINPFNGKFLEDCL